MIFHGLTFTFIECIKLKIFKLTLLMFEIIGCKNNHGKVPKLSQTSFSRILHLSLPKLISID